MGHTNRQKRGITLAAALLAILCMVVLLMVSCLNNRANETLSISGAPGESQQVSPPESSVEPSSELSPTASQTPQTSSTPQAQTEASQETPQETEPELEPEPEPEPPPPPPWLTFSPGCVDDTDPLREVLKYTYAVQAGGTTVEEYLNPELIQFTMPEDYTKVEGVTTFRGNNFRDSATYGTADITEEKLTEVYRVGTGTLANWSGTAWTGQPAIIKWDYELQQKMNLLPGKIDKEGLVEVIQGAVDGYVYFFDLEDGKPTRNRLNFGEPIKGAVTVDPRGYPILYIGQGDIKTTGRNGYYIYSLFDFKRMYYLNGTDNFALMTWGAFDGNPLFDIPNDRMILNGENGLLYNIKLNTVFDLEAGEISIDPEFVKYRYNTGTMKRRSMESSLAAFANYAFTADSTGFVQCVDLMTFTPVWVRDCTDDTDASPVLDWEEENGLLALYTACGVEYQGAGGLAYIRKLNAENGDLLWEHTYPCHLDIAVSGGVLATPVVGRGDMSHLVIFWVAKVRNMGGGGVLVAFDKYTGEIVWENVLPSYGWSSPVAVYTDAGTGYLVVCDASSTMFLVRGTTGEILDKFRTGSNAEASPAVYGNMVVVGTRGCIIFGVRIS
ncbi:MAG: pyrrolo-quinoline quinone [Oscillospiraceae bacterium]|nr:pyrrolo-quinoline quinone [Oscillospiraceae bacterium]